jgi:hypothetical protein
VERRLQFSVLDEPKADRPGRAGKKKQKAAKPEPVRASRPAKRGKLRGQPKGRNKRR